MHHTNSDVIAVTWNCNTLSHPYSSLHTRDVTIRPVFWICDSDWIQTSVWIQLKLNFSTCSLRLNSIHHSIQYVSMSVCQYFVSIQFTIQFSSPTFNSRWNHIAVEFGWSLQMKCKACTQSRKYKDYTVALCQVEYIIRTTVQGSIHFHLDFTMLRFYSDSIQPGQIQFKINPPQLLLF